MGFCQVSANLWRQRQYGAYPPRYCRYGSRQPTDSRGPTSTVLRALLLRVPGETVSLGWLIDQLGERSFGIVLLLLGLLASLPGASVVVILIAVPAFQMLIVPPHVFPRFLAARTFRMQHLATMLGYAVPSLRYLERFIRPRWRASLETTKRVVGRAILLVGVLLFAAIPLSNAPPALTIVLLAFASFARPYPSL